LIHLEQKEDKKKRVFWRDMINSELQENTGVSDRRLEEKLESHKEEAKKKISATRPIEDFKDMINYKYEDLTVEAMNQLKEIIVKFILESFKGSYYIKSIECIKQLRDACVEEDEVDLFNEFLETLRQEFPKEKFMDFWRLLIDNRITLISSIENMKSSKSESECKEWIDSLNKKETITSTLKDLDDLIADID
jgi:ATP-dependent DNA helicase 2 subunit 2